MGLWPMLKGTTSSSTGPTAKPPCKSQRPFERNRVSLLYEDSHVSCHMFAHVVLTSWSHGCHVTDYGEFLGRLPQLKLVLAHDSPILSRSRLAYEPIQPSPRATIAHSGFRVLDR